VSELHISEFIGGIYIYIYISYVVHPMHTRISALRVGNIRVI